MDWTDMPDWDHLYCHQPSNHPVHCISEFSFAIMWFFMSLPSIISSALGYQTKKLLWSRKSNICTPATFVLGLVREVISPTNLQVTLHFADANWWYANESHPNMPLLMSALWPSRLDALLSARGLGRWVERKVQEARFPIACWHWIWFDFLIELYSDLLLKLLVDTQIKKDKPRIRIQRNHGWPRDLEPCESNL